MTKQEAIQEQIDDIMDTFEFEDVHKWMETTEWTWGQPDGSSEVPDLYEIKTMARARLKEAAKCGYSCTGGFTAERFEGGENGKPWITLRLSFGYSSMNDGTIYDEQSGSTDQVG